MFMLLYGVYRGDYITLTFRVFGLRLGFKDHILYSLTGVISSPIVENQMEKEIENDMETVIHIYIYMWIGLHKGHVSHNLNS